eukprot:3769891-Rhodomonas_salina.4
MHSSALGILTLRRHLGLPDTRKFCIAPCAVVTSVMSKRLISAPSYEFGARLENSCFQQERGRQGVETNLGAWYLWELMRRMSDLRSSALCISYDAGPGGFPRFFC